MLNKIKRFADLLIENYEMDEQFIKELCTDLSDDFIKFEIRQGYFSKQSYRDGIAGQEYYLFHNPTEADSRFCYCLTIHLEDDNLPMSGNYGNEIDQIRMTLHSPMIHDKKIYKIFDHLNKISNQVDDSYLMIRTISPNHRPYLLIHFYILSDEEVEMKDAALSKLYYEIRDRLLSNRSDFANNTIIKIENEEIVISTSSDYTDRKLQLTLKGIDMTDYNIKKDVIKDKKTGSSYGNSTLNYDSATIVITKK